MDEWQIDDSLIDTPEKSGFDQVQALVGPAHGGWSKHRFQGTSISKTTRNR